MQVIMLEGERFARRSGLGLQRKQLKIKPFWP